MRPIYLTEELKAKAIAEFTESLEKAKMADGEVKFNKRFTYSSSSPLKATIHFTPEAYIKMITLILDFATEVGWYGKCERIGKTEFLISDIFVYPQRVTGATIDMDEAKNADWWQRNLEAGKFETLEMHGHSHVNMAPNPSGEDIKHQETTLAKVTRFYVFMIWNKRLEHRTKIYDVENNILYEDSDIVYVVDTEDDIGEFLKEADKEVTEYHAAPAATGSVAGMYSGLYADKTTDKSKDKDKDKKDKSKSAYSPYYDGYYDRFDYHNGY